MTGSPRVVVRGEAATEVPPDSADLVVTVQVRDRQRDRAVSLLTERQRDLLDLLGRHGAAVGSVRSETVAVVPEPADGGGVRGSVASTTTRVRVEDVTAAAELVVAVAALPDTAVHGPHWRLREEHPAHQDVRSAAVRDAVVRARSYAAALDCRLTGLVEVRDVGTRGGGQVVAAFAVQAAPVLDLQPAPQEVRGAVEVIFTMSDPDEEVYRR